MERLRLHAFQRGCCQRRHAIENHFRAPGMRRHPLSFDCTSVLHRHGEQLSGLLWRKVAEFTDEDSEEYVAL